MLLAKSISAFIDIILGILSIGYVLQAGIRSLEVCAHSLERVIQKVTHPAEPLELLSVEIQTMLISAGQDTSYSVT